MKINLEILNTQHKIPALQSVCSRSCVGCGRPAAAYCAGCGVTPYCGERCQRRDWPDRHRAVCHNLARLSGNKGRDEDEHSELTGSVPPAAPLRPPHAPRRDQKRDDDSGSENNIRKQNNKPAYNNNNNIDNKNGNNRRTPRNNLANKRQGEMRRPHADTHDDEDWTPKKADPTPVTPPVKPQKSPTFNKFINEAPTYRSTKVPQAKLELVEIPKPMVKETTPVGKAAMKETIPMMQAVKETIPVKQAVKETIPVKRAVQETVVAKQAVCETVGVNNLVPKHYLIETLDIGDSAVLSVDAVASACRSPRDGYVCLSMSERYEGDYESLCETFGEACAKSAGEYRLVPGETCAYLDPEDGGWYRGRCLAADTLALLDASRLAALPALPAASAARRCTALPPHYRAVPEFCCLLRADNVQVGMSLTCTLVSKTAEGYRVAIVNNETGATGEGEVLRWTPTIEYPPTTAAAPIPEVSRPEVANNARVLLVHATAMDKTYVRLADSDSQRKYDDVLEQVALCGRNESPLQEPPTKGQTVLGKFEDGLHYRALCKRTNVKQNKYLLEYIEFGNVEISPLENLFACPARLDVSSIPPLVSLVALARSDAEFTPPAAHYVEQLKQNNDEIILTVASGGKVAASGDVVNLTLAKNRENVNKKIIDMCTPEWKKIEERGGDVIETKRLMYTDLEFLELPAGGCTVDVLDVSMLQGGILSACQQGLAHTGYVLDQLTQKMADYCNSEIGKQPYLPKPEELCIAQFPPYPQWFRAVLAKQMEGPGGSSARVCYLDYGNVAEVPVQLLRKMLPEFITRLPVLASHLMIRDFPEEPTASMLSRAREFLRLDEDGRGELRLARCERQDGDVYLVDAPELLAHVLQH